MFIPSNSNLDNGHPIYVVIEKLQNSLPVKMSPKTGSIQFIIGYLQMANIFGLISEPRRTNK